MYNGRENHIPQGRDKLMREKSSLEILCGKTWQHISYKCDLWFGSVSQAIIIKKTQKYDPISVHLEICETI